MSTAFFPFRLFVSFSADRQQYSLFEQQWKKKMKETMRRVRFGPELVGRTSGRYAGYTYHSRNRSLVIRLLQWMFSQFRDESSVSIGNRSSDTTFDILRDRIYHCDKKSSPTYHIVVRYIVWKWYNALLAHFFRMIHFILRNH